MNEEEFEESKEQIMNMAVSLRDGLVRRPTLWQELIDSINTEPEKWVAGDNYTLKHIETGIELWTANMQPFDLNIYRPNKIKIPLLWKFRIHKAIKNRWRGLSMKSFTKAV